MRYSKMLDITGAFNQYKATLAAACICSHKSMQLPIAALHHNKNVELR